MDIRVILFVTVVVQGCCALGFGMIGASVHGFRALRWWAGAYVGWAAGPMFVLWGGFRLRFLLPTELLVVAGAVLVTHGMAEHLDPDRWSWRRGAAVLWVYLACVGAGIEAKALPAIFVSLFCVAFGLQLVLAARWLLRDHAVYERTPARLLAGMLLGVALLAWMRAVAAPMHITSVNMFSDQPVRFVGLVLYLLFSVLLAFLMVWLVTSRLRRRMEEEARQDALTGLLNRRALDQALGVELERARRAGTPVAVVSVDLDHFKQFNDLHGHAAGDTVLMATAQTLTEGLRPSDVLARYGGEEFVVVLPGDAAAAGATAAERLRQNIAEMRVAHAGLQLALTASCGVVVAGDEECVDEILGRADRAMYAAKAAGRNCVHVQAAAVAQTA